MLQKTLLLVCMFLIFGARASFSQSSQLDKGIEAYSNQEYEQALNFFNKHIEEVGPGALVCYYRSLLLYYYENENREALEEVTKAIDLCGKKDKEIKSLSHQLRGDIYSYLNDSINALKDFTKSIEITPENPTGYVKRGNFYLKYEKFYEKGLNDFDKAIKLDPGNEKARLGRGRYFYNTIQYPKAITAFDELILLNEKNDQAFFHRGWVYYMMEKYDKAIEDLLQAYLLENSDRNEESFLSAAYRNMSLAIAKVSGEIADNPNARDLYYLKGRLQKNNSQYLDAIKTYDMLLGLTDEEEHSLIDLQKGFCYYYLGAYKIAEEYFSRQIEQDSSTNDFLYAWRGMCKLQLGNFKDGDEDFSIAIEKNPRESWYYFYRSRIRYPLLSDKKGRLTTLT